MRDDVAGTFSIDSIGEVKSYDEGKSERTYFTTTFVFPVEKKNQIIIYIIFITIHYLMSRERYYSLKIMYKCLRTFVLKEKN